MPVKAAGWRIVPPVVAAAREGARGDLSGLRVGVVRELGGEGYQPGVRASFEQADVLVSPTAPTTAFKLGEKLDDPLAMYLNDVATIPANLAGVPGLSLPSGLSDDGLPVGFQVLAPAKADDRLYRVGAALEALLENEWGGPLLLKAPELEVGR